MDPIETKHREVMNVIADTLDKVFKGYGFCLLVFDMDSDGRVNYICNVNRDDMVAAMKEFIARHEGRYASEAGHD